MNAIGNKSTHTISDMKIGQWAKMIINDAPINWNIFGAPVRITSVGQRKVHVQHFCPEYSVTDGQWHYKLNPAGIWVDPEDIEVVTEDATGVFRGFLPFAQRDAVRESPGVSHVSAGVKAAYEPDESEHDPKADWPTASEAVPAVHSLLYNLNEDIRAALDPVIIKYGIMPRKVYINFEVDPTKEKHDYVECTFATMLTGRPRSAV